jgi:hypothetical protein
MPSCVLNGLPIDIIHILFSYFYAHEILYSLSNISVRFDAAIVTYLFYHVNFQSIRHSDFIRICRCIKPHQVITLTLSDEPNIPNQSQLFLTRFSIEQFSRLRMLRLIDLNSGP